MDVAIAEGIFATSSVFFTVPLLGQRVAADLSVSLCSIFFTFLHMKLMSLHISLYISESSFSESFPPLGHLERVTLKKEVISYKEVLYCHTRRNLKSRPQNSNSSIAKVMSKHYTLYCSHWCLDTLRLHIACTHGHVLVKMTFFRN